MWRNTDTNPNVIILHGKPKKVFESVAKKTLRQNRQVLGCHLEWSNTLLVFLDMPQISTRRWLFYSVFLWSLWTGTKMMNTQRKEEIKTDWHCGDKPNYSGTHRSMAAILNEATLHWPFSICRKYPQDADCSILFFRGLYELAQRWWTHKGKKKSKLTSTLWTEWWHLRNGWW